MRLLLLLALAALAACGPRAEAPAGGLPGAALGGTPATGPGPGPSTASTTGPSPGPSTPRPASGGGIISLTPSLTETLYDLGVGDRLVAVSDTESYPPEALRLPQVGARNPDYERVLAMQPDLVVADSALVPAEALERLKKLGLPLLTVESRSLEDLARNLPLLGERLGVPEAAARLRQQLEAELAEVDRQAAALPRRPTVFVEIWSEPLMTAGQGSLVHRMVERAGGENAYRDLSEAYPTISAEDLLKRDPEILVLTTSTVEEVARRPGWDRLSAVKEGRVYRIDPDLLVRPTLRGVKGLRVLQDRFREAVAR